MRLYLRWIEAYPLFAGIFAIVLAMIFGLIGRDLGLNSLFWHEKSLVQFAAGASVGVLALTTIFLGFLLETDRAELAGRCRRTLGLPLTIMAWARRRPSPSFAAPENDADRLRLAIEALGVPLVFLLFTPVVISRLAAPAKGRLPEEAFGWYLPLGAAAAFLTVVPTLRIATAVRWQPRRWQGWVVVLIPAAVLNLLPLFGAWAEGLITAAMAICLLCAEASLLIFATHGRLLLRFGLIVAVVLLQTWTNSDPYKLTYPGMAPYYPGPLKRTDREDGRATTLVRLRTQDNPLRVVSEADEATREGIRLFQYGFQQLPRGQSIDDNWKVFQDAIAQFNKATAFDPRYRLALHYRGLAHARCAWLVRNYYDRTREPRSPEDSIPYYERAQKDFSELIRQGDHSAQVLALRGGMREQVWSLDRTRVASLRGAIDDYREACKRDPSYTRTVAHLARLLAPSDHEKEQDEARALYQQAAELMLDSHDAGIYPSDVNTNESWDGYRLYRDAVKIARDGRRKDAALLYAKALQAQPDKGPKADRRDPIDQFTYVGSVTETPAGLLNDLGVLHRWRLAMCKFGYRRPSRDPVLVIVAVSGGGIVAAGWTERCLTAIEQDWPEFPYHVRVITGASGGMVGAGHYVATLPSPGSPPRFSGEDDIRLFREQIDADSLTPVISRMVLRDLPSIFIPTPQQVDRGRVLEQTWLRNTGRALGKTFQELRQGELQGWRPSLIISPLLVENGAQMAISNIDTERLGSYVLRPEGDRLRGINLHFFATFPLAYESFQLGTALRMNAAFPFVTPAVSLPTNPPYRVADAGYVDNYGVRLAAEWIRANRNWIQQHTSGVALVQIRAYPLGLPGGARDARSKPSPTPSDISAPGAGFWGNVMSGMQWLTSPVEGYATAKKMAMITRNDDLIEEIRGLLPDHFETFVFECQAEVPLSWSITLPDRLRLDEALKSVKSQRHKLVDFVQNRIPPSTDPARTGSE